MTIAWGKLFPLPGKWRRKKTDSAATDTAAGTAETTGGGDESTPWEKVADGLQPMVAEVIKSRLESEDVPAIIRRESIGSVMGLTVGGLGMASVWVPQPLLERARTILADDES